MMDAETIYHQIGRLIEEMPDFSGYGALNRDQLTWIARARALIKESGDIMALAEFETHTRNVGSALRQESIQKIALALHKALAVVELKAPANVRGSFIPAGNSFDAFAAVTKVFQTASKDIFVVDPYMDETVLTDFAGSISSGVSLRLLSDQASVKPSLAPATQKWVSQHGANRPLQARIAPPRTLHDRAIFVDTTTAWILTQSLKDFAKRSPAEIVRADDTATLKIGAYETIWASATVIV